MTFSISGFCQKTSMVGVAITTSSICVASRCPWVRAGVGAAATQNVTDPSLGNLMLDYLEEGLSVQQTIDKIINDSKIHKDKKEIEIKEINTSQIPDTTKNNSQIKTIHVNNIEVEGNKKGSGIQIV